MLYSELNHALFRRIHTQGDYHDFLLDAARFFSEYLTTIVIVALLLGAIFFRGVYLSLFIKALVLTLITSCISNLCDDFLYSPRPFAVGLTRWVVDHAANNSFPSSHALVISTIAFAYLFSAKYKLGALLMLVALAVSWSRIYLGVHFPFDIVGSLLIALLINMLAWRLMLRLSPRLHTFRQRRLS